MRRVSLILLWVGLVTVVSWLGFEVLVAADATVSPGSLSPIIVGTTEATTENSTRSSQAIAPTTTVAESSSTSTTMPTTTSTEDETTSSTTGSQSTSTTVATTSTTQAGTTSTTEAAASTTSTTIQDVPWSTTTVPTAGGSVTVRYKPELVEYLSAAPNPGYTLEIDKQFPEVDVEFIGSDSEVEVRIRWDDGELRIEVNEE